MKKRSFAFALVYIKCFRTYSLYLSLRLPAQILYAGIHLCPLAVNRSCFGYSLSHLRTAAACLSRCIRHRRRSKAKPLRGRRGRSRAVHRIAKVRTAVKPAGRAALIRHGAAQKRRAVPPSPRGRLRRRSKAKPVSGFLFMRSALTVGIKSKSPPCSNEHGGLFLSTERAQNQYFIIMATQPPCSRRFSVVKPASRQAFSTSSARVSIIPEIINVPPLSR